ncbi:hypothetical protein [Halochromatium salexigens]|uniref:PAS domain-containing protein n=1 Tax=Halochromatium salexigens TaxID=49447 RepID=A0AAJ0UEV2_HALSE|nr:hypothetical protein [Halochromatium salexigens]MBK5930036.1 hypothetical protein [Halochromatium salexigens]
MHRIDADGRIRYVSADWLAFAAENDYPTTAEAELGRPLFSAIVDEETRHIYALLIQRARASRRTLQFGYRCDSPDQRRWMRMHMRYLANSDEVEFSSRLLRVQARPRVPLLERPQEQPHSHRVLSMCSWCKAVLAEQAWVEVEQAVKQLQLFTMEAMPRISHGICPDCSQRLSSPEILS